jgi:periplasmic protein CpxP/Spy
MSRGRVREDTMSGRAKCLAVGAAALVVTLAGGLLIGSQTLRAQGPGGRGRFGGPDGPGGPMGRGGPGGMGLLMLRGLDLNDAQREQVKQIFDSHRDEQKALGDRSRAAQQALALAKTGEAFDEGSVRARAAELALVEADMAVASARTYAEVFQILTGDQQSQLKKQQTEMRQHMEKRQERPPRGGQRH